jgi:heavy metal sensor kinase
MIKSIRLRFFFWYTLILAVTFSMFAFVLYFHVSSSLKDDLNNVLLTKAEGIAASINTYWETEKMDALRHGARKTVFSKINNMNFLKIAKRWVEERSNDPDLMDIIVQIYKPDGNPIAFSPNAPTSLDISEKTLHSLKAKKVAYEDRHIALTEEADLDLRVLQVPVMEDGRIAYIVQVAGPLNSIWTTLKGLKFILFLLLPVTVVLASVFAGEFLASITLKPLKHMINTARQITAENMSLRITAPESKDEIRQLAETFNEMLEKIQQVIVSQRRFIQDVSHELRTPITIMRGELEVALKRDRTTEEYGRILKSNLEETKKIGKLLEDLLALARFDSSSATLVRASTNLSSLLRDILDDMEILARQKGIALEYISQDGVTLPLDKDKIMRVFVNVIDNAIKYTPEHGSICVEVIKENNCAFITVTDTGIGIPQHDLPHIFDRFYQVDKSRSSAGFGLGLSIARSIIEAHGGYITVESMQSQGTTFLISLPIVNLVSSGHPHAEPHVPSAA